MNRFTDVVPLVLTPLTPIHIGCGEDFEPTNYVIDGGMLYAFEPTDLPLDDSDRRSLVQSANRPGLDAILAVQQFFHQRHSKCRAASRVSIPVARGVADWYESRIGTVVQHERSGRQFGNELGIERTVHHPYSGKPYLPGSSIKGSARTGWLNGIDTRPPIPRDAKRRPEREERSVDIERDLLGGSFSSDPFRLVEFADVSDADLKSRVVFAVDRRKRPRADGKEKDLSVTREVIAGGQFRAAQGEIRFKTRPTASDPRYVPRADKCIGDFAALARTCNRFYCGRLGADLSVLAAFEGEWRKAFKSLIAALKPALDDGRAMLLRVGRHSGAESVTLERHRWICIMEGPGKSHWAPDATTMWLAADRRDARTNLRPFGWLLLERADDLLPDDHLRSWCDQETNNHRAPPADVPPADVMVRPPGAARPRSPTEGQLRQGSRVTYQEEAATIRQIDGSEALIAFEGGDTEWVPLDKLGRS